MGIDRTITVEIGRPPDDVFDVLTDPERLPEWQPLVEEAGVAGGGPVRAGARIREVRRVGSRRLEQVVEVTGHERPRRFALRIVEGPVPVHADITLEPEGGGSTAVHVRMFGRAPRLLRPFEAVLAPVMARQVRGQYAKLKAVVEAGPASPQRGTPSS